MELQLRRSNLKLGAEGARGLGEALGRAPQLSSLTLELQNNYLRAKGALGLGEGLGRAETGAADCRLRDD